MRKYYVNGSGSPLSVVNHSRTPSPVIQILPSLHRFQPRQSSKRPILRYALALIAFLAFFTLIRYIPSSIHSNLDIKDDSFLLGEDIPSVRYYDLSQAIGSSRGWERNERILICVPLRDAASILPLFFSHMRNLTYPHHLMDLAFLVSDSKDDTLPNLLKHLTALQQSNYRFNQVLIFEKDFGQGVGQGFSDRHSFEAQGPRRKVMARARNWLLTNGLTAGYSWVYWRDADVETAPATIIEDLMRHNKDVIVPNVWRPLPDWLGGEQPYDLNSWQESETALQLARELDEDAVIVEGYAEYATWRPHLAYLRDPYGDPMEEMDLDGVGGVSILTKARVFRSGTLFPAFSYERHAETEGFGKWSRRMGFEVVGLPHYVIWHVYEPSEDDLFRMEQMKREKEVKELDVEDVEIAKARWEKDRKVIEAEIEKMIQKPQDGKEAVVGGEEGPVAHVGEEGVSTDQGNGLMEIEKDELMQRDVAVESPKE